MSDDRAPAPDEEANLLAGEFVLGTLESDERAKAATLIRTDADFAARIAAWEDRLADLNDAYVETPVPDAVMTRIEARLFPASAALRGPWFGWLAAAMATAILAIAAVMLLTPPPITTAPLIATLGAEDGMLAFEARHDGGSLIVVRLTGPAAGPDQVHELWIIAPEAAPVSLGLLGDAPLAIPYPMPPPGWILAISLEPAGGSATGVPTGPVLAKGPITDL